MRHAARLLSAMVVATACSEAEPRPVPPPGIPHTAPIVAPTEPDQPRVAPGNPTQWRRPLPVPPTAPTPPTEASATAAGPAENASPPPRARDLSEELVGLVGAPSACFAKRTAGAGTTLSFNVVASVTPTGMITRAEIGGGGLSPEESDCVKARVLSARFRSPIEDAPLSVQATVELRERAPQKAATP